MNRHFNTFVIERTSEKKLIYVSSSSEFLGLLPPLQSHTLGFTTNIVTRCVTINFFKYYIDKNLFVVITNLCQNYI